MPSQHHLLHLVGGGGGGGGRPGGELGVPSLGLHLHHHHLLHLHLRILIIATRPGTRCNLMARFSPTVKSYHSYWRAQEPPRPPCRFSVTWPWHIQGQGCARRIANVHHTRMQEPHHGRKESGIAPTEGSFPEATEKKLHNWVHKRKEVHTKETMDPTRVDFLTGIGFEFTLKPNKEQVWQTNLAAQENYPKQIDDRSLYDWKNYQHTLFANGGLDQAQEISSFEGIGVS